MAMQAGAPLVPAFAFGQSDLYSYTRFFYDFPKHVVSWQGSGVCLAAGFGLCRVGS